MPGPQVDLEQARAHADEPVEAVEQEVLELRIRVEQRQIQPDAGAAYAAVTDIVVQKETSALALQLERAAIVGHELVGQETGRDRADQPDVPECEKDRAPEATGGEIAADQRMLVLSVNH